MNRSKVILLGNGVNRIDNLYSWEDLMYQLMDYAGLENAVTLTGKPFPLLYEEIFLRWSRLKKGREMDMKRKIRQFLTNIRANELHERCLASEVSDILTTNYDYNLEMAHTGRMADVPHIPPVKGNKYSIARRRAVGEKVVWHIHGEVDAPGTMLLGYEQYAGYLQNIRNYVVKGMYYKDYPLKPLSLRLRRGQSEVQTWIDHLFLSDVYILGLSLDFVEIHLWWLLAYRARLIEDPRFEIRNRVIYLYPAQEGPWSKAKIDLLCATQVECLPVNVLDNDWKGMYQVAFDYIDCSR